jgi:hypothetical protein
MLRRTGILVLLLSASLYAQSAGNVYIGYSFVSNDLHINRFLGEEAAYSSKGRGNLSGWNISGEVKIFHWIGLVADFSGNYGSDPINYLANPVILPNPPKSASTGFYTFLFGPRVSVQIGKIRPFAEVFAGVASQHVSVTFDSQHDRNLATAVGGGLDYRFLRVFAWRVQADYVGTRLFKDTPFPVQYSIPVQRNVRLSTGCSASDLPSSWFLGNFNRHGSLLLNIVPS